jgi:ribosomal protein S18 acetylase RimI-like enzyme
LIIRPTKVEDILQLEDLFLITQRMTFSSRHADEFKIGDFQISIAEDVVFVAENDGKVLGFVSIYPADNFVHNLFVHPDYQRLGIGSELLIFAEKVLKKPITLKVAFDNESVGDFYKKHGYTEVQSDEPYLLFEKK